MKRNNLQSIFCAIPLLLVYAFCLSSNSKSESVVECCKHVLLKLTHSNTVVAIVSFQTNMPNDKATSVYITTNTILRSFCNEAAFGERWILEGWSSKCGSQKQVLYDTHLLFKAKAENKKKLQKKAELIAIDKLKTQLNSTNENERTYASELLWSKWKISGGSRRLVERARDISLSTEMCLMHEISIAFQDSRMTQDNPIQCLQLRIEPVGTNMMDPLSSNIIHIP